MLMLFYNILDPFITFVFKFKSELLVSRLHYLSVVHYVYEVRDDIVEKALIVSYYDEGVGVVMQLVDAVGHDSKSVDVES